MIDSTRALELMQQVTYKPTWTFDPELCYGGVSLWVTVQAKAPDTDIENARRGYPRTISIFTGFMVELADCPNEETFLRKVFEAIFDQIERHESREFFRVRSQGYRAPFHPHRDEGRRAWIRTA